VINEEFELVYVHRSKFFNTRGPEALRHVELIFKHRLVHLCACQRCAILALVVSMSFCATAPVK
jgi:hypothetical protein